MHLGIDLGTSNSAVAGVSDGRVRIFKTPEGTDVMPTVIHRDKRGRQLVGVRAYDQAAIAPDNAVEGFKRLMGTDTALRFASTGEVITPENAATEILRTLVGHAMVEAGADAVTGAVVTIPAAFNQIQSEATLAAAHAAGLDRVALLQEPVAAALASMAGAKDRDGLFLVYDLGGGTFDAALVHAIRGEVTVLAHEGVNMLGGRDLDRRILDAHVIPWLTRTFELPPDFAVAGGFRRLLRMARRAAEVAKIGLSTADTATIAASDEEIRLEDLRGEPIYLDVPIARAEFEALADGLAARSIACCRDMLAAVGYRHEDVARVVLVGGPTKMPFLRRRIQDELAIEVEDVSRVDPMTAVAAGAAVYSEGRDWSAKGTTAKPGRRSETATGGAINVAFDYEARTADDAARLTVKWVSGDSDAEVLVESLLGWSSGRRKLSPSVALELPLREPGRNIFRVTVFGADGLPVSSASREIVVERLIATTGGVPATHHIAVKVLGEDGRDALDVIVRKGHPLPASGVVAYRLAEPLRSGTGGSVSIEFYQVNDERVRNAHLNLFIGEFRLKADDLPPSAVIRKGDEIRLHWTMLEGQGIAVEVEIPSTRQRFDGRNFYDWQPARQDFSGEAGANFADLQMSRAERELERAEDALPPDAAAALPFLRGRLQEQGGLLRRSLDPDARRQAVEEIRIVRQEIAVECQHPQARLQVLRMRTNDQKAFYARDVRSRATPEQATHYDRVLGLVEAALDRGVCDAVTSDQIDELQRLYWTHGFTRAEFFVEQFHLAIASRRYAKDFARFDELVARGERAIAANDLGELKAAFFELMDERHDANDDETDIKKAALMRA